MQVFKVIKLLLGKLEKASEDPESALNQAGGHDFFFLMLSNFHPSLLSVFSWCCLHKTTLY